MHFVTTLLRRFLFLLVLLVATGYSVFYFTANSSRTLEALRGRLSASLPHAQLELSGVDFSARPFGVRVSGVRLRGSDGEHIGSIREMAVDVAAGSLLGGTTQVNDLIINGFDLDLVRDSDGRWNLREALVSPPPLVPPRPPAPPRPAEIERFSLTDGTLRIKTDDLELVLSEASCRARLRSGPEPEGALMCRADSGKLTLSDVDGDPVELPLTGLEVGELRFSSGRGVSLEKLSFHLDHLPVQIDLAFERGRGLLSVPQVAFGVNAALSARAVALLSQGALEGAVTVEATGGNEGLAAEVNIKRLTAVGPLVFGTPDSQGPSSNARGGHASGVELKDLRIEAGLKGLALGGEVRVAGFDSSLLRLENLYLHGSLKAGLERTVLRRAMRGDLDGLWSLGSLGQVEGHVARAQTGVLLFPRLPLELPEVSLQGGALDFSLTTEGSGTSEVYGKGERHGAGAEQRLSLRLRVEVNDLPTGSLISRLEGEMIAPNDRAALLTLLDGIASGFAVLSLGARPLVRLAEAELHVRRDHDIVSLAFAPETTDLVASTLFPLKLEAVTGALWVGEHRFSYVHEPLVEAQ